MKPLFLTIFLSLSINTVESRYQLFDTYSHENYKLKIISEIKYFEGFSHKAYKDTKGINTIGYGCVNYQKIDSIGLVEAEKLLLIRFDECEKYAKHFFNFKSKSQYLATAYIIYCFGIKNVFDFKLFKNNRLDSSLLKRYCYVNGKFNKRAFKQRNNQIKYFYHE